MGNHSCNRAHRRSDLERLADPSCEDRFEGHRFHFAKFYRDEADLIRTLAEFTVDGLDNEEAVLVLTTPDHREKLTELLSVRGRDPAEYIEREQLLFVEAEPVRRELASDGPPDREAFEAVLGDRTEQVIDQWSGVRVFGELVELLARQGQIDELKCFEELWSEYFGGRVQTMCGYRLDTFGDPSDDDAFRAVCKRHHNVLPAGDAIGDQDVVELQRRTLALSSAVEAHRESEAQLEQTVEDVRERNRRKDEFLAMLAHELRNPLASMLNAVQLMEMRGDASTAREREILERQLEHMVHLVDDLLDVSRITRGKIELEAERLDIADVIEQAVEVSEPLIEDNEHRLHVSTADTSMLVDGDTDRLVQVVSNLLTNAAKYTPQGGEVWLEAHPSAETVEIRVRDNGRGIEPERLWTIFELFYRDDDESPDDGGLGVGLALAKQIVEQHDGTIEADSDGAGQGSEFVVRLPLVATSSEEAPTADDTETDEETKKQILLVDDNRDLAGTMGAIIDELGYEVRVAHDGASSLEIVESFEADIALVDINMPDMSGFELAEHLQDRPAVPDDLSIVALTGYGEESEQFDAGQATFDEYLVKPVSPSKLRDTLEKVDGA